MIIKKSRFNYFNFSSLLVVVLVLFGVLFGVNVIATLDSVNSNITTDNAVFSNATDISGVVINLTVVGFGAGENITYINVSFDANNISFKGFIGPGDGLEINPNGDAGTPNGTVHLVNVTHYTFGNADNTAPKSGTADWSCFNESSSIFACNTSEAVAADTSNLGPSGNDTLIILFNVSAIAGVEEVMLINVTTSNNTGGVGVADLEGTNTTTFNLQVDNLQPRLTLLNITDGNTTYFGNGTFGDAANISINQVLDGATNWTITATFTDAALRDVYLLFFGNDGNNDGNNGNVTYNPNGSHIATETIVMTATHNDVFTAVLSADTVTNDNVTSFIFLLNDTFNNQLILNETSNAPFIISSNSTVLRVGSVNITDTQTGSANTVTNPTTSNYVSATNTTIDIELDGDRRFVNFSVWYNLTGDIVLIPNGIDERTGLHKLATNLTTLEGINNVTKVVYRLEGGGIDLVGNDSNTLTLVITANDTDNVIPSVASNDSYPYVAIRTVQVTVDGSQPNPILTAPTDTTVSVRASIKYTCTGTDTLSGVSTYVTKLTKPGGTSVSKSATAAGVEQTFKDSDTNSPGIYSVKCTLTDNVGNTNSVTKEFSALYASGGGGAAAGTGGAAAREVSFDVDFSQDNVVESSVLVAEGSSRTFTFDGATTHTLRVDDVEGNLVTITISSDPQTLTLNVGESKEVDLNEDGINDVEVTLNSVDNGVADIAIKKIEEGAKIVAEEDRQAAEEAAVTTPTETTTGTQSEGGTGTVVTIIIIIVVVLLLLWWFMRKK